MLKVINPDFDLSGYILHITGLVDITIYVLLLSFQSTINVISADVDLSIILLITGSDLNFSCVISLVMMLCFQDILNLVASDSALEVRLQAEIAEVKRTLEGKHIV